jgi:hypothetical protein
VRPIQRPAPATTADGPDDPGERLSEAHGAADGPSAVDDEHASLVARYRAQTRARREATRSLDDDEHDASWREPVTLGTLADELLLPDAPTVWTIDDVMPAGSNTVVTAQYKTGKTTLMLNLVRSLVDRTPFLGTFGVGADSGTVAVWNYEVGPSQFRRWLRDAGIVNVERVVVLHLRGYTLPLHTSRGESWAVEWLSQHKCTTWIVDPLARALSGLDENSNQDVGRFLETLDNVKQQTDVTDLVMPTHTGRAVQDVGQERSRGATRIDDWADVRWLLTKDEQGQRYFAATGRDVDTPAQELTYDNVTRSLSLNVGVTRRRKSDPPRADVNAYDAIVRAVNDAPGQSTSAVVERLKGEGVKTRRADMFAAITALVSQDMLSVVKDGRSTRLHPGSKAAQS